MPPAWPTKWCACSPMVACGPSSARGRGSSISTRFPWSASCGRCAPREDTPVMRIALAAHSARRVGGVEQYLAALAPALLRAGHDVSCWFETDDADHSPILDRGGLVPTWTASREPDRAIPELQAWRPDVVYTHG